MSFMGSREQGATSVEYGLIVLVCVLAAWAGIELFSIALGELLTDQSDVDGWVP